MELTLSTLPFKEDKAYHIANLAACIFQLRRIVRGVRVHVGTMSNICNTTQIYHHHRHQITASLRNVRLLVVARWCSG